MVSASSGSYGAIRRSTSSPARMAPLDSARSMPLQPPPPQSAQQVVEQTPAEEAQQVLTSPGVPDAQLVAAGGDGSDSPVLQRIEDESDPTLVNARVAHAATVAQLQRFGKRVAQDQ